MIHDLKRESIKAGEMVGTARVLSVRGTRLPEIPKGKPLVEVFAAEDAAKTTAVSKRQRKPSAGECAYTDFLMLAQAAGVVQFWKAEPWGLTLADKTIYTPDFFVVLADGRPCMVEIKAAYKWRGSLIKHKVARSLFPQYAWLCLEYKKGVWRVMFKNGREPVELIP